MTSTVPFPARKPPAVRRISFALLGFAIATVVLLLVRGLRAPQLTPAPPMQTTLPVAPHLDSVAVLGAEYQGSALCDVDLLWLRDGRSVIRGTAVGSINYHSLYPQQREGVATRIQTIPWEAGGRFIADRAASGEVTLPHYGWDNAHADVMMRTSWAVDDAGHLYLCGNFPMTAAWQSALSPDLPALQSDDAWVLRFPRMDLATLEHQVPEQGLVLYARGGSWRPDIQLTSDGTLWLEPTTWRHVARFDDPSSLRPAAGHAIVRWTANGAIELIPADLEASGEVRDYAPCPDGSSVWLVRQPAESYGDSALTLEHLNLQGQQIVQHQIATALWMDLLLPQPSGGFYCGWYGEPTDKAASDQSPYPAPERWHHLARYDTDGVMQWIHQLDLGCDVRNSPYVGALDAGERLWLAGYYSTALSWNSEQRLFTTAVHPNDPTGFYWSWADLFLLAISPEGELGYLQRLAGGRIPICSVYIASSHYDGPIASDPGVGPPVLQIRDDQLRLLGAYSGQLPLELDGRPVGLRNNPQAASLFDLTMTLVPATTP